MANLRILSDYMSEGGAKNKAFISDRGEVYIVKGFRLVGVHYNVAVIDADLIARSTLNNFRKRTGLPLSDQYTHLYDYKATFSQIKKARLEAQLAEVNSA